MPHTQTSSHEKGKRILAAGRRERRREGKERRGERGGGREEQTMEGVFFCIGGLVNGRGTYHFPP